MAGFELLLQKQLKGKQMQKEMSEFIRERIKIEEEYAKNLAKLSQNSLAAQEEGSLGEAWAQVKKSLADEAEVHLKFSAKLHSEVEKPLMNFRENFKKDMKKCDHHIADLRKQLASRYAAVEKARKALTERQRDLEMKTQQLEIKLSNKTEEDIKKARRKSTQAGDDLMRCVDLYNQAQSKWFEEMVTTTLVSDQRCIRVSVQGRALRNPWVDGGGCAGSGAEVTVEMVIRSALVLGPRPQLRTSLLWIQVLALALPSCVNTGSDELVLHPSEGSGSSKQTAVPLGKIAKLSISVKSAPTEWGEAGLARGSWGQTRKEASCQVLITPSSCSKPPPSICLSSMRLTLCLPQVPVHQSRLEASPGDGDLVFLLVNLLIKLPTPWLIT
ncbi:growth arrest-specific protein 7 isoform X1 [Physeter macrocephalus]|uniref:Growth arrest-specific protein 7 isoform X1 n=1 Tax=Physeter macrocephalus TaxID=9755 RepID=A0A9W2X3P7_PHYMC|nr:growth arrest-specific protein 7 isoform X1 [Physeter catodon]